MRWAAQPLDRKYNHCYIFPFLEVGLSYLKRTAVDKMHMKQMLLVTTALLLVMLFSGCDALTPLEEFEPGSQDEKALKMLLIDFKSAVNKKNTQAIADLLHENARIMMGRERKIYTKKGYLEILPRRFAANRTIKLSVPRISTRGSRAEARVYMWLGGARYLISYDMVFYNGKWYISGWKY